MAKQTFHVSELDPRCREYLVAVRRTGGRDMAGVFLSSGAPHATWGFPLTGLIILATALCMVTPPLNDPLHQAMLLTAAILLGGWFCLAGIRIAVAYLRGYNLGTFTYVDPRQLWVVDNTTINRWPTKTLESVTINGNELSLEYPDGVERVAVPFEIGILEIAAYLDSWVQARGDGELNQELIDAHAAVARATAYDQSPAEQPDFSLDIPVPNPDERGRRPYDWPILLCIAFGAFALFFAVKWMIYIWHDHAVFNFVRNQSPAHWRAYLLDERNTMHRDTVKKMLHDRYQQKADQIKQQIQARKEPAFPDSDVAVSKLLMSLVEAPAPIVTLRVQDLTDPDYYERNRLFLPPRTLTVQNEITDAFYSVVGQDLVSIAAPPDDAPAFIEVQYKFAEIEKQHRLEWTVTLRSSPDAEPLLKTTFHSDHLTPHQAAADNIFNEDVRRIKAGLTGTP